MGAHSGLNWLFGFGILALDYSFAALLLRSRRHVCCQSEDCSGDWCCCVRKGSCGEEEEVSEVEVMGYKGSSVAPLISEQGILFQLSLIELLLQSYFMKRAGTIEL